jgi:acyl dehydratase
MVTGGFDTGVVGRCYEGARFSVTSQAIASYAAATNDRSSPAVSAGEVAPPAFAYIGLRPVLRTMLKDTTPLYEQLMGVHGEQDIVHHHPVTPGMELQASGTVVGIRARSTGVAVVLKMTTSAGTDVMNEQWATIFFPGQTIETSVGDDAPDHRVPDGLSTEEPVARALVQMDADQPARYARASGDTGRYHLDDAVARSRGFNGVIAHGMCTFAFAGHALVKELAAGDATRVRRLAARFARPVYPGEALTVSAWRLAGAGASYAFETRNPSSELVLAHGRIELD